ncbi:hypothetical protein SDC9_60738 [bioreactor metagenome]|uniref:Uncharacterized protein n=1 Tax=bioreactor metagenome TaxID=1076179 RepID=A0A644XDS2_9ZZZZ
MDNHGGGEDYKSVRQLFRIEIKLKGVDDQKR